MSVSAITGNPGIKNEPLSKHAIKEKKAEVWKWKIPKKNATKPNENDSEKTNGVGVEEKVVSAHVEGDAGHFKVPFNVELPRYRVKSKSKKRKINPEAITQATTASPSSSPPVRKRKVRSSGSKSAKRANPEEVKQADFRYGFAFKTSSAPSKKYWSHLLQILQKAIRDFHEHLKSEENAAFFLLRGELEFLDGCCETMNMKEKNYIWLLKQYKLCVCHFNEQKRQSVTLSAPQPAPSLTANDTAL